MKIKWLDKPQKHDYPAATSFLSSINARSCGKECRRKIEKKLR